MAIDPKLFETLLLLPAQVDELTAQIRASADALQEQVERIRGLMAALNPGLVQPPGPPPHIPVEQPAPPRSPPPRIRLSPDEEARRIALLGQFDHRTKMREEIEAEMEAGA